MQTLNLAQLKQDYLLPRQENTHKGDYGHVFVVGGDYGMAGAVRMAGEAAARTGAGLVSVVSRPEHAGLINALRPELLTPICSRPKDFSQVAKNATVLALGPGLGRHYWGKQMYQAGLNLSIPKVVDADALWFLANNHQKRNDWVLTPHPKEAANLLGITVDAIQSDRVKAIMNLQKKYGGVVVLKGHGTLVIARDGTIGYCAAGNPGMATGGMGDVLTGIIAGLLAQKLSLFAAAALGVVVHATAGDQVAVKIGQRSLLATDLFAELSHLLY